MSYTRCDSCGEKFEAGCMQGAVGMLKSHTCTGGLASAYVNLNDCPVIDDVSWSKHGCEHFHPDVGEYWRPPHISVHADMDDMAVLRVLSDVMDEYGLEVHQHHGVTESNDEWARLVVAPEGDA